MTLANRPLENKIALVTGGGSGIGQAIAERLTADGATVAVNTRSGAGQAVADAIGGSFYQADLASMDATRALGQRVLADLGRVDILVNNAGYNHIAPVDEFPEDIFVEMLQVMTVAPFQLVKQVLPGMKERGWGRIINIASTHAIVASPNKSAYAAAKHGIVGFTKSLALEVGELGITANAICPAFVRTPMTERQIAFQIQATGLTEDEVIRTLMVGPSATKRMIQPDEVAALTAYLASDAARSITGTAQLIDAGWTAS
ncbi:MAG: 3-hydroxybutyrate dehydrogenase [Chloroflexi bacterium]|nr:3-hydroxybutyrate dehydrogenase [Chloroflexota bacterium]